MSKRHRAASDTKGANTGTSDTRVPQESAFQAIESGEWLPADELQARALAVAGQEGQGDAMLDLAGIDHLEAGVLQVLLAFRAERQSRGHRLFLTNISPGLARWFRYAGAERHFLPPN